MELFREKYHENSRTIRDEDLNIGPPSTPNQESGIFYDIYLSHILHINIHHHCETCNHGDFDVWLRVYQGSGGIAA